MCTKVLIIDDDSGFVFSLMNRFVEQDYAFSLAESIGRAKVMLENNKFDVVLANSRVPGGYSYSLKDEIKSFYPDTRMIFMSSIDSDYEKLKKLGEECVRKNELYGRIEAF